jgi:hypothetical protein
MRLSLCFDSDSAQADQDDIREGEQDQKPKTEGKGFKQVLEQASEGKCESFQLNPPG